MSQGNATRVKLPGVGSAGTSDSFSATLALDTRWEIVPGSMKVWAGAAAANQYAWGSGNYLVARDDGAGNIVGEPAYSSVNGTINYATGAVVVNEGGSPVFANGDTCWVEYYERFPSNTPADDFWVSYGAASQTFQPLILHRYDHSNFANRNLVNHGQWCMLARNPAAEEARAEFILKDPDFYTDAPVMSEIAVRAGNDAGSMGGCYHGPHLCQRRQALSPTSDTGYYWGPWQPQGSTEWYISLSSGQVAAADTYYYAESVFAGGLRAQEPTNPVYHRKFNAVTNNTPPNILADDWHKFRMITTMDADPGDIHIQLLMAIGYTEVDKALPTFQTYGDVWHQLGNNTPVVTPGFSALENTINSWNGRSPQAYPPTKGYQGFLVGRLGPFWSNQYTYFDDFRCYRMP